MLQVSSPKVSVAQPAQETFIVGDLVLLHVGTTPYAGVLLRFTAKDVVLVRVQKIDGPAVISVNPQSLSMR